MLNNIMYYFVELKIRNKTCHSINNLDLFMIACVFHLFAFLRMTLNSIEIFAKKVSLEKEETVPVTWYQFTRWLTEILSKWV